MLMSSDLINRLAPLELKARHIVEGFISGLHRSPFYGFSVEFAEHRPYNAGDELRHIDWKVFAKTERFYVKQYEEETNLRCHILLDISPSLNFQHFAHISKKEYGIYLAAAFLYVMQKQRDAVGITTFDENERDYFGEKASESHLRQIFSLLGKYLAVAEKERGNAQKSSSSVAQMIYRLGEKLKKRSLVVIISDFFESTSDHEDLLNAMKRLRHAHHEVILFHLLEKRSEIDFDIKKERVRLQDLETENKIELVPSQIIEDYRENVHNFIDSFHKLCSEVHIDYAQIDTEESYDRALLSYLNKRKRVG